MGRLNLRGGLPSRLRRNGVMVPKAYLGTELVWDAATMSQTEGPKIDPSHPLAQKTVLTRLPSGQLQTMTGDANSTIADGAFASTVAGTQTFAKEALPATPRTLRVTGLIKADKTSGRFSRIGICSTAAASATNTSPTMEIGHVAGSGIVLVSQGSGFINTTLLAEANVVDGAWYRVTVTYETVLTTGTTNNGRVLGSVENLDGSTPTGFKQEVSDRRWAPSSNTPRTLVARTNSALGTVKDVTYVDNLLGVANDSGLIVTRPFMGAATDTVDRTFVYSKGKAAPARIIICAGGSGTYGGEANFGTAYGRTGVPYDTWREAWRQLAGLGYTLVFPQALHEGWGADDHLAKQVEALNMLLAEYGPDCRLYYLGYSMGGLSAWRAIMGRSGFPSIRAAYIVAGATGLDRYYDIAMYSAIKTRWPDRTKLDEPCNFAGSDLIARGTRVRLVTSTSDTSVPKVDNHDVMKAKYAGSALFSELVHAGIDHFDPAYWNVPDMVAFYEGQDLG